MKIAPKVLAGLILASALAAPGKAQSAGSAPAAHKSTVRKKAAKPSLQSQLDKLRTDLANQQSQIVGLQQQLSDRQVQLEQAQRNAAAAEQAARQAQAAADQQQQTLSANTASVSELQSSVSDLKGNQATLVSNIQENQSTLRKAIESPDALHYKGIEITPGGFMAAETVWRQRATASDIATPFSAIPFTASNAAKLSEFYGSGRQSRVSFMATGKTSWGVMHGYVEADFLGTGVTSNNNQSNSYAMRQRVVWAEAATNSGWHFYGGQMWSLAAERAKLLSNLSGDVMTPQTIDPNYAVGFQWTRQYGFRVVKDFGKKAALGVSIENAQLLTGGTGGANTVSGNAGTGGGLYNLNATYSFNQAPDLIAKLAVDPGFGHYEVYGIGRFIHQRVYPSVAGQYTNTDLLSGIGGSFRVPVAGKFATLGVSGLWGQGMGRYGDTTLADVTFKPDGEFAPLHNASALGTLELHPNARLTIYGNYGIDYASRKWYTGTDGKQYGYGNPFFSNTGCNTESAPTGGPNSPTSPGSCSGNTRNVQEAIAGWWYDFYRGPKGRLRQGFQYSYVVRQTWNGLASSTSNGQPKAIDNMFFTSFRYYLP